jgi:hypothetical protein
MGPDDAADRIDAIAQARSANTDAELIAELAALPGLADEDDPCWSDDTYWTRVAYPYLGLAQLAAIRGLRAAVPLLLERACFGDPGEIMRGLRHALEAIVEPEWSALTEPCLTAIASGRPGSVLWAVDQLIVLDDVRARAALEALVRHGHPEVRWRAEIALDRLSRLTLTP